MSGEEFTTSALIEMQSLPKSKRLAFLKSEIGKLPAEDRLPAERAMMLTLYSVDHAPPERRTKLDRLRAVFHRIDLVGLPLILFGGAHLYHYGEVAQLELNLSEMTVAGSGVGVVLVLLGACLSAYPRLGGKAAA